MKKTTQLKELKEELVEIRREMGLLSAELNCLGSSANSDAQKRLTALHARSEQLQKKKLRKQDRRTPRRESMPMFR